LSDIRLCARHHVDLLSRPSFQEIEARLSAELGDDSEDSTVESEAEEEDVPSMMKKVRPRLHA
jgi:hypothetical protein